MYASRASGLRKAPHAATPAGATAGWLPADVPPHPVLNFKSLSCRGFNCSSANLPRHAWQHKDGHAISASGWVGRCWRVLGGAGCMSCHGIPPRKGCIPNARKACHGNHLSSAPCRLVEVLSLWAAYSWQAMRRRPAGTLHPAACQGWLSWRRPHDLLRANVL